MMNKLMLGLVASIAVAVGTSFGEPPRAQSPQEELVELKRQVARLQADVNVMKQQASAAAEAEAEVDAVVAYLNAQAQAASALQKVLVDSEEKGFTFGINPESREVLLVGFDAFAATLQENLPGAAAGE